MRIDDTKKMDKIQVSIMDSFSDSTPSASKSLSPGDLKAYAMIVRLFSKSNKQEEESEI